MKKNIVYVTRHDLSSLFEKSLTLLGQTVKASLPGVIIIYTPIAFLSVLFLSYYFDFLPQITNAGDFSNAAEVAVKVLGFIGVYLVFVFLSAIGSALLECMVSRNAFKAMTGEKSSWTGLLREVVVGKAGKIIALSFLQGLVFLGFFIALFLIILLSTVLIALEGAAAIVGGIIIVIGSIAFLLGILMAAMVFQISFPVIANEDLGPLKALGRTAMIVKGNVWRVFGFSLLFIIALYIGVAMATSFIRFLVSIPFAAGSLDFASAISANSDNPFEALGPTMRSMFIPYSIMVGVSGILSMCIAPLFHTLFYIDLRVRAGDLPDTAQFSELGTEPPTGA